MYSRGYVKVWAPDHPKRDRHNKVFEHRLVAEKILGRYLADDEFIHHINEVRDDNRPENLFFFRSNTLHTAYHKRVLGRTCDPITESNLKKGAVALASLDDLIEGHKLLCTQCGRLFMPRPRGSDSSRNKFCSQECYWKSIVKAYDKTCPVCGKVFSVKASQKKTACSWKCAGILRRAAASMICEVCGKEFYAPPSRLERYSTKYCSRKCKGVARRTLPDPEPRACQQCGAVFTPIRAPNTINARFCSRDCHMQYRKAHANGRKSGK